MCESDNIQNIGKHLNVNNESKELIKSAEDLPNHRRLICNQCERPQKVCWCKYLPSPKVCLKSDTSIIVIQHPSEKKRKIRTALMALHGLKEGCCEIFVRRKVAETDSLCERLKLPNVYLMYPSAQSKDIGAITNDTEKKTLVILDGTWDEARKIYARSLILQRLPSIHLELDKRSEYVLRTQPSEKCLSTIETISHSLDILESDPSISEKLLRPLQMMCKFQLQHGAVKHDNKSFKKAKVDNDMDEKIPKEFHI